MNKVILIDLGIFMHQSVYAALRMNMHPPWLCLRSILSCLKYIDIQSDDILVIACDDAKSWRTNIDAQYKANRGSIKALSGIDWPMIYHEFDTMLAAISISSPFNIIRLPNTEADDIIAYACQYRHDRQCIIISTDSDFDQLETLPNVQIFSSKSKKYKIIKYPERVLARKIEKERTDNLISPILNQADYDRRSTIVNLIKLPDEIEQPIHEIFKKTTPKTQYDTTKFPYQKMVDEIGKIFNTEAKKVVTYGHSFKRKPVKVTEQQSTLDI
jgi:hypothetical protein